MGMNKAIICERCGTKIHPMKDIKLHMACHELRDLQALSWMNDLSKSFQRMRELGWA